MSKFDSQASACGVKSQTSFERRRTVTTSELRARRVDGAKISMVTCYDSSFARLLADTNIDMILVGDSLGNVMLGHDDTLKVTMQDMVHHTASVTRVLKRPFICSDMPFMSYQVSVREAVKNAGILIKKGGAHGVKLEGGEDVAEQISAIARAGIPVVGHLGLTPQSVHQLGGFKVQAKDQVAADKLIADAIAVEKAGAFALVLEMIPAALAKQVTEILSIPTIGIGAGSECSGQVLVLHDLLGFDETFNPKFLKKYLQLGPMIQDALNEYDRDVKDGSYPASEHSFSGTSI